MGGVAGVGFEAGVVDVADVGALPEPAGDLAGGALLGLEADGEGFDAALHEPRVVRGEDGAEAVLDGAEVAAEVGVARHGEAGDDVAVAAEELGGAVDDEVEAEFEGALQVGGHEGVVGDGEQAVGAGDLGHGAEVGDLEEGVGGGLDEEAARGGGDGAADGVGVGAVGEGDVEFPAVEEVGEDAVGAAVDVAADDEVVAGLEEEERGGGGGHAGGEGEAACAAFELGDGVFEGFAGGVVAAGVVVGPEVFGVGLVEGGGLIDRDGGGAGVGVAVAPGVDDVGFVRHRTFSRSRIRSRGSSMPTERRSRRRLMPSRSRVASSMSAWVCTAG